MKPKRNLTNTQLTEIALCLENDGDFYRRFTQFHAASSTYRLINDTLMTMRRDGTLGSGMLESVHERELLRYHLAENWDVSHNLDDRERADIEDRYKDFYSRPDDYDPDNVEVKVKVHDPEPVWKAVTVDLSHAEIRALAASADSYQLQGEIAGHMAKATFRLDKVEAALPDGFKTATPTGRWTCSEGETRSFHSALPSLQQIPKTKPADIGTTSEFNTMTKIITIRTVTTVSTDTKENSVTTYVNGIDIKTLTSAQIYGLISDAETLVDTLSKIQNKPLQLQAEIAAHKAGIAALVNHLDERFKAENPDYVEAKATKPRKARAATPAPAPAENGATA